MVDFIGQTFSQDQGELHISLSFHPGKVTQENFKPRLFRARSRQAVWLASPYKCIGNFCHKIHLNE